MAKRGKSIDFLSFAKARKTTYEFSDKPVSDSDVRMLLDAGRWAPNCGNLQPWQFVVVKNKRTIAKISRLCNAGAFHTDPPIFIILMLDTKLIRQACGNAVSGISVETCGLTEDTGGLELSDHYMCLAQAGLNMTYAAQSRGIKSCFLTPKHGMARKLVSAPPIMNIPLIIGIGYERKGAYQRRRTRKPLHEVVSYERFGVRR